MEINKYNFALTIIPAIEAGGGSKGFLFESLAELVSAKDTCADMLLFMQDQLKVMKDYSNGFIAQQYIDSEWVELTEDELI